MKKWLIGGTLFLCVYLGFVIANVPAQWVVNQITLPKNIILQGIKGTVWEGNVERVVIDGYSINHVNTEVNVLSFFTLNPSVNVTFGGALVDGPEGKATISGLLSNSVTIKNAQVSVLANDIAQHLTLPIPITVKKYINLTLSQYEMGKPICSALKGKVSWDNASVTALENSIALGTLKGDLTCDKGNVQFSFDPKNNLGLTLVVTAYSPKRVSGKGFIIPGSKFPKALNDVLPFLGSPDSQGRYKLNF